MLQTPRSFATNLGTDAPPQTGVDSALFQLEARHQRLSQELHAVERQLRRLRTDADLCPECGGSGERWVRGGIYGERQLRSCVCRSR